MKLETTVVPNRDGGDPYEYEVYFAGETNRLKWIARIENFGYPRTDNWRILRRANDQTEKWSGREGGTPINEGHYKSWKEAFTVLKKNTLR